MNTPVSDADRLFTLPEAATYLRLARQTLYNLVNRSEIPFLKAGRSLRFRKSDLDDWMVENANPTRDQAEANS